jgi:hypothetical protein
MATVGKGKADVSHHPFNLEYVSIVTSCGHIRMMLATSWLCRFPASTMLIAKLLKKC